jgi:quinol monooxygenase YgiN
MTYLLINRLTAKPGQRDAVARILVDSGAVFDDDPACLMSLVVLDAGDDDVIWVQDIWTDREAHDRAMAGPEMREGIEAAIPLLEGVPEQHEVTPVGGTSPFGF